MERISVYREHFDYDFWANEALLNALIEWEDVPARAVELLAHNINALEYWQNLIRGISEYPAALWPDSDLAKFDRHLEEQKKVWDAFI